MSLEKDELRKMLTKTMDDIMEFKHRSQQDKKIISELTTEKNKLAQKINTLIDQNKTLKKLRFRTEDDNQAREVARRELELEQKKNFKRREYSDIPRPKKRNFVDENLESGSNEDEIKEKPKKNKKKMRKNKSRQESNPSSNNSESNSEEKEEEEESYAIKKKKELSQIH